MSLSPSGSEIAIWERVIHTDRADLPVEVARYLLALSFEQPDLDRMHELAVKNQAGTLDADEAEELRNYRQIGLQLDLLRSKARQAMPRGNA